MLNDKMLTDKEIFVQMLERDVVAQYSNLSNNNALLQMLPVKEKIYSYADYGISYLSDLLFGSDEEKIDADEASQIAELVAKDKIQEYRDRIKKERLKPQ